MTVSFSFILITITCLGYLRHIDMRKPGEFIWEGKAHDESIGGLSLSAFTRGLLVTAGHDQVY